MSPSENPVFTFARIDPDTLEVTLMYNTNGGAKWAEGDIECLVPFDVLSNVAVRDETTGLVTLQADPAKLAAKTAQAWADLRTKRNALLAQSDWTCSVTDYTVPNKDAWVAYRAQLRNITDGVTDPLEFMAWPTAPA